MLWQEKIHMAENDHNRVCKGEENKKIRLMESKRNTLPTV